MPGPIRDEHDLLAMSAPEIQRALLKVPDDLIAQALAGAPAAVAGCIVSNLSARRAGAVRALAARLEAGGELGPRAAKTALRNLVRQVFDLAGPEAEGAAMSRAAGAARPAGAAPRFLRGMPARGEAAGPDLSPAAFARLREVRAAFDAARRASPFVQNLERGKRAASAAVLFRAWLGRRQTSAKGAGRAG